MKKILLRTILLLTCVTAILCKNKELSEQTSEPLVEDLFIFKNNEGGVVAQKEISFDNPYRFKVKTKIFSHNGCKRDDPGCTYFLIRYPVLSARNNDAKTQKMADQLNSFIQNSGGLQTQMFPFEEQASTFIADWQAHYQSQEDMKLPWFRELEISILGISKDHISLMESQFQFHGGAHPNTEIKMNSFNTVSGEQIFLKDLFKAKDMQRIARLCEESFRKNQGLPAGHSLSSMGFDFPGGKFYIPENFAITEFGLLLFFNQYEIAAYAAGWTSFLVPYSKLKPYLKPEIKVFASIMK